MADQEQEVKEFYRLLSKIKNETIAERTQLQADRAALEKAKLGIDASIEKLNKAIISANALSTTLNNSVNNTVAVAMRDSSLTQAKALATALETKIDPYIEQIKEVADAITGSDQTLDKAIPKFAKKAFHVWLGIGLAVILSSLALIWGSFAWLKSERDTLKEEIAVDAKLLPDMEKRYDFLKEHGALIDYQTCRDHEPLIGKVKKHLCIKIKADSLRYEGNYMVPEGY